MKSRMKLLSAILTGATIGIAGAVLFAPQKGKVVRKKVRRKINNGIVKLANTIDEQKRRIKNVKTEINELKD